MPKSIAVQNNFVGGLKTEFTGLNFPENACTAMDNTVVSLIGDSVRRNGINFENNYHLNQGVFEANQAVSSYRWKNAGGDGLTEILVLQVGDYLYFYESSNSTVTNPLSSTLLNSSVYLPNFLASGSVLDPSTVECQYSDGNGYLFVYHPYCDPFFCSFSSGVITSSRITVQIRDFAGIPDSLGIGGNIGAVITRPSTLSNEHQYNLQNQGWASTAGWVVNYSASGTAANNLISFSVNGPEGGVYFIAEGISNIPGAPSGLSATVGQAVNIYGTMSGLYWSGKGYSPTPPTTVSGVGVVSSYSGTTLAIAVSQEPITPQDQQWHASYFSFSANLTFGPAANLGQISTWFSQVGNYPSNSDVWWSFKDSNNQFSPATTLGNVTVDYTPAPNGHYILNAFGQTRSDVSGVGGIQQILTYSRPSTGAWFQGRVWFSGVNASFPAENDAPFYTWAENIYFSQVITDSSEFGYCFQTNDPTSETLFDLLDTDGGVIQIQGCGAINKLFPIQNGLLVFATNGVWFITGSTGIGFSATDYTITKISAVQSISSYSFIDVLGYPIFWNEEGIYGVEPNQQGGLSVNPMTVGTIRSFYNTIPLDSKRYARGSYNPITYVVEWVYRSTQESGINNRYKFDSALCFGTLHKAFYPYSIANNNACYVCGLTYMNYPTVSSSGGTALNPTFKYLTSISNGDFTFSEENDNTTWLDWHSYDNVGVDAPAYFTAGYSLAGKAVTKWAPTYVHMYSRNSVASQYTIQGIWDYAINPSSGKYSTMQNTTNWAPNYSMLVRRHKIRGHGRVLQLNIESIAGQPFDIMGWSVLNQVDDGV